MKSTMTEKEFRKKIQEVSGYALVDRAVEIVREASWEFAPEPELPELLVLNGLNELAVRCQPAGVRSLNQMEARVARDRYNAYPRLREKAEALVAAARQGQFMSEPFIALEAELAKAPK